MEKKILFEINALYRDNFRITSYKFGKGEKTACIIGNLRGNEVQQLYTCSKLVSKLKELEQDGKIKDGKSILVIPSGNPYSLNVKKRFWATDNTDINRMFPGYNKGETTQRIADAIFKEIKDYKYGIQFASFYMPGTFMPHVRMMKTGFENVELAKKFGFPYVVLRTVRPYDTTTLNYNWQIWGTNAFSIYTTTTEKINKESAKSAIKAILNFLEKENVIDYKGQGEYSSHVINDTDLESVRVKKSGILECLVKTGEKVSKGQVIGQILHPYEGDVIEHIKSPVDGVILFENNESPLIYDSTSIFKIIKTNNN